MKNEFKGWKLWEILWLTIPIIITTIAGIYTNDTLLNIVSAITGIAACVLLGKGKISTYIFGIINAILYGYISYQCSLYAETMLNILYYVPMQIVGIFMWRKNMNDSTHEVLRRRMNWWTQLSLWIIVIISTIIYGYILKLMNSTLPFLDAFVVISLIAAMAISVKRYVEQWWFWLAGDIAAIIVWEIQFNNTQNNMSAIIMWSIALINDFIMTYKWYKEEKLQDKNEKSTTVMAG